MKIIENKAPTDAKHLEEQPVLCPVTEQELCRQQDIGLGLFFIFLRPSMAVEDGPFYRAAVQEGSGKSLAL